MSIKKLSVGTSVTGLKCILGEVTTGKTKKDSLYYRFSIQDKTGKLKAVWWNPSLTPESGHVYEIAAKVSEYNGERQVTIESMTPCSDPVSDFIRVSDLDLQKLWESLTGFADRIRDAEIKKLVEDILLDQSLTAMIQKAPAANKVHHAWVGGLMEHTVNMLTVADGINETGIYARASMDWDIIYSGILLHDIGKIMEYDQKDKFGEHTVRGMLEGHISWIYSLVGTKITNPNDLKFIKLRHVLLSHHGRLEYGSPVIPKTVEAVFVHNLDMLDSHIWAAASFIADDETPGNFTANCFAMGTKLLKI